MATTDQSDAVCSRIENSCKSSLPDYADLLLAFHAAYAGPLREVVGYLPIRAGDRVLDVACGDAAFARWLSECVGDEGSVVAIDLDRAWLQLAAANSTDRRGFELLQGDVERLPLPDDFFDVVWCAQSLYSLPRTQAALAEMARVARPGGIVAILENDTLHHILLPWPIDLELKVRQAELAAFRKESPDATKYYIGRQLTPMLYRCGLTHVVERAKVTTRQPPLDPNDVKFLTEYLRNLRERVSRHLPATTRKQLEILASPQSDQYLLSRPDLSVTCLDRLVWGVKPGITDSDS